MWTASSRSQPFSHSINIPHIEDAVSPKQRGSNGGNPEFDQIGGATTDGGTTVFPSQLSNADGTFLFRMTNNLWFSDEECEEQFAISSFFHTRWRFIVMGIVFILGIIVVLFFESGALRPYYIASLIFLIPTTITDAAVVLRSHFNASTKVVARLAVIHEIVGTLAFLFISVYFGIQTRVRTENCEFMIHHDPNVGDHEHCPQLVMWNPFFIMMPLFLGQPRFFISFLVLMVAAVLFFVMMRFHHTSVGGSFILHIIYALHLIFVGAFKFILERQERRRFAAQEHLMRKLESIRRYSDSLHEFVATLAPQHLHGRLASTSIHVDVSTEAVAIVSHIHDSSKFINSTLPAKAASTVSHYNSRCVSSCSGFGLHHIRTVGDANFFVSNMFNTDHPTVTDAATAAIEFITLCARSAPFDICTGVASGTLTGLPLGRTCIRYDIFGSAMSEARGLALLCPPGQMQFEPSLLAKLSDDIPCDVVTSTVALILKASEGPLDNISFSSYDNGTSASSVESKKSSTHIHSVSLVDDRAVEGGDFNINNSTCCAPAKFSAERTRNMFGSYNRGTFRHVFVFCNFFFALQVCTTIASVAEERSADMETSLIIFFATMVLSLVCFCALGITACLRIRSGQHHEHYHVWSFMVLCMVVSLGNHLSRPSVIGTSNPQFIWSTTFSVLFIGASIEQMLGFQVLSSIGFYALSIAFRPSLVQTYFMQLCGAIVFSTVAVQQNRLQLSLFSNLVKNEEALIGEQELCRVREAVRNSLLPLTIQPHIGKDWKADALKIWSSDSCIVITIEFNEDAQKLAALADDPDALRSHVEGSSRLVEDIVPKLNNSSLSIIKAFSGVMTIAGPLTPDDSHFPAAVSDAFELLQALHAASAGLPALTVAVASEQVVNVLRLSEFPSYELMGPAVNTSRAMANACPAPMTVVDEKLTQFYLRECTQLPSVQIGDGESWRLRDMGVVRVRHVRFENSTPFPNI